MISQDTAMKTTDKDKRIDEDYFNKHFAHTPVASTPPPNFSDNKNEPDLLKPPGQRRHRDSFRSSGS